MSRSKVRRNNLLLTPLLLYCACYARLSVSAGMWLHFGLWPLLLPTNWLRYITAATHTHTGWTTKHALNKKGEPQDANVCSGFYLKTQICSHRNVKSRNRSFVVWNVSLQWNVTTSDELRGKPADAPLTQRLQMWGKGPCSPGARVDPCWALVCENTKNK